MNSRVLWICFLWVALLVPGCATGPREALDPVAAQQIEEEALLRRRDVQREALCGNDLRFRRSLGRRSWDDRQSSTFLVGGH